METLRSRLMLFVSHDAITLGRQMFRVERAMLLRRTEPGQISILISDDKIA